MKILDVRTRPPFGSIRDGMFNNPGRELFEPEAFAPRFGMSVGESARQRSMSLFIEEMDAAGITLGAVLIRKSTGMDNNDRARLDAAYPGRFIGIAGIDPLDGEEALRETEHFALKGACRGILLEPGFCSTPLYANDQRIYPIYELCQQHGIPVFLSFGGYVAPDLTYNSPFIIDRLALDFPSLKLVIAHGGWPFVTEICHVAFNRENVYLAPDLYTMNVPGNRDYLAAANYFIPEKFLFGTAYPCVSMQQAVDYYRNWGLRPEVLPKVMYQNAADVLGVEAPSE